MRLSKKYQFIWKSRIWFILPGITGVGVFTVIPFCDVVRRSFMNSMSGRFCGIENYQKVFTNEAFLLAMGNTCKFILVCLPLLIFISFILAALIYKSRWSSFLKSALLFPMAVPAAVVVLVWKMLFYKEGIFNGILYGFHFPIVDWMGSDAAFYVLVISYLWKNIGYTVILWLAGMANVSETILEAARVDGASELKCMTAVVIPALRPVFYTILILSFLNSFKVFREAWLVAGAYPHESMYFIQHLFNNWFLKLDVDKMSAAAVCIAGIFAIVAYKLKLDRVEED